MRGRRRARRRDRRSPARARRPLRPAAPRSRRIPPRPTPLLRRRQSASRRSRASASRRPPAAACAGRGRSPGRRSCLHRWRRCASRGTIAPRRFLRCSPCRRGPAGRARRPRRRRRSRTPWRPASAARRARPPPTAPRRCRRASPDRSKTAVRWQIPRAAWTNAFIVTEHAPHVGMLDDRAHAAPDRAGAALAAFARVGERLLIGLLAIATPCKPTPSLAAFIITNIAARPRFSSPTR